MWLMRIYISPCKLQKFNPNISDHSIKCEEEVGVPFFCICFLVFHLIWFGFCIVITE